MIIKQVLHKISDCYDIKFTLKKLVDMVPIGVDLEDVHITIGHDEYDDFRFLMEYNMDTKKEIKKILQSINTNISLGRNSEARGEIEKCMEILEKAD